MVYYTYDPAGRLTQVNDYNSGNRAEYDFSYDNMNRLTSTSTNYEFTSIGAQAVQYGYDAASNRVSMTDPQGSQTSYGYDNVNRLTSLSNSWAGAFGFSYDNLSRRTQLTRPNGVNTNYSYDNLSRLLSLLHQAGSDTLDGAGLPSISVHLRIRQSSFGSRSIQFEQSECCGVKSKAHDSGAHFGVAHSFLILHPKYFKP